MIAYCAVEEASVFQQSHNNLNASVLVLNHTYEPLNVTSTRRAIILVFNGKAEVVKHNAVPIRSFNHSYERPIVVRLLYYARRPPVQVRLNRKSVLARDNYTCQYCGYRGAGLTVDHILPRNKRGKTDWANLVCCCVKCNTKKSNKTPKQAQMTLLKRPRKPAYVPYIGYSKLMQALHNAAWKEFLLPFVKEQ